MKELKIEKIQDKEKIDAVCQYTGNNCSTSQHPTQYVDPCYDDCRVTLNHTSYYIEIDY